MADILSKKGIITDRQRLQETILKPLVEHGFLEKFLDPDNKSRDVYHVSDAFLKRQANVESTLIDTSLLKVSCVRPFVENYTEQRFNKGTLEIQDESRNKITPKDLLDILYKIDAQTTQNRHKIGSNEASKSIEGDKFSQNIAQETTPSIPPSSSKEVQG